MSIRLDIGRMNPLDPVETRGYGLLLFAEADRLGLFAFAEADTGPKRAVMKAARAWLGKVRQAFPAMSPAGAFGLLTMYDFLHRLVHHTPMPADPQYTQVMRAFDAMMAGDKAVNRYQLFCHITAGVKRGADRRLLSEPTEWQKRELNSWLGALDAADGPETTPYAETLELAITLLRTDLRRFGVNSDRVRDMVKRRCRPLLDTLTRPGHEGEGFRTFENLLQLLKEFRRDLPAATYAAFEARILTLLLTSADIDIYTRTYYQDYILPAHTPAAPSAAKSGVG